MVLLVNEFAEMIIQLKENNVKIIMHQAWNATQLFRLNEFMWIIKSQSRSNTKIIEMHQSIKIT